jgi:hypothetical protein
MGAARIARGPRRFVSGRSDAAPPSGPAFPPCRASGAVGPHRRYATAQLTLQAHAALSGGPARGSLPLPANTGATHRSCMRRLFGSSRLPNEGIGNPRLAPSAPGTRCRCQSTARAPALAITYPTSAAHGRSFGELRIATPPAPAGARRNGARGKEDAQPIRRRGYRLAHDRS